MFGLGFSEIIVIAIIAVLFLGPDKLPSAMVDIAKFFRQVKRSIGSVKDSLEEEIHLSEIQKEALAYKKEILGASDNIRKATDINAHIADFNETISAELEEPKPKKETPKEEKITFEKKIKQDNTDV